MAAVGKWVSKNIFGFKAPKVEKPQAQRMPTTDVEKTAEEKRRQLAMQNRMGGKTGTDFTAKQNLFS